MQLAPKAKRAGRRKQRKSDDYKKISAQRNCSLDLVQPFLRLSDQPTKFRQIVRRQKEARSLKETTFDGYNDAAADLFDDHRFEIATRAIANLKVSELRNRVVCFHHHIQCFDQRIDLLVVDRGSDFGRRGACVGNESDYDTGRAHRFARVANFSCFDSRRATLHSQGSYISTSLDQNGFYQAL